MRKVSIIERFRTKNTSGHISGFQNFPLGGAAEYKKQLADSYRLFKEKPKGKVVNDSQRSFIGLCFDRSFHRTTTFYKHFIFEIKYEIKLNKNIF